MTIDINKQYRTEAGKDVRIYATDGHGPYPVHGAVRFNGEWVVVQWSLEGELKKSHPSFFKGWSLVELKPKRVAYVNLYPEGLDDIVHPDRARADINASSGRIGCNRIELEEGRWDD